MAEPADVSAAEAEAAEAVAAEAEAATAIAPALCGTAAEADLAAAAVEVLPPAEDASPAADSAADVPVEAVQAGRPGSAFSQVRTHRPAVSAAGFPAVEPVA